jgi:hypothetical protein
LDVQAQQRDSRQRGGGFGGNFDETAAKSLSFDIIVLSLSRFCWRVETGCHQKAMLKSNLMVKLGGRS